MISVALISPLAEIADGIKWTDTVGAISALVGAAGLLVSAIVWFSQRARERREQALQAIQQTTQALAALDPLLLQAAGQLSNEQVKQCSVGEPFAIAPADYEVLGELLGLNIPPNSPNFQVGRQHSVKIRAVVLQYLNIVECALSVKRHKLANDAEIVAQFASFFNRTTGRMINARYRQAYGGDETFPSTIAFEEAMRRREQDGVNSA